MNLKYRLTIAVYETLKDPNGVVFHHNFNNIDELFKSIWKNTSSAGGMALTTLGLEYFINLLKLQYWDFTVLDVVSADLLMMERYMTSPYSLVPSKSKHYRNLILFDETVATQLVLYGGDLKLFLAAQDSASDRPVTKR
jgi:hypothetical protein